MLDWTSRPCTSPSCFRSSHYAFPSPAKVVIHGSGCATCQRGQRCSFRVWEQLLGKAVKESWWRRDLALTLRGAALAHGDIRCLDPLHCTEFRVSYHVCVGLQQLLGDAARGSSTGARPPPSEWIGVLHERGLPAQPASGETSGSKWQGDDEWCKGMVCLCSLALPPPSTCAEGRFSMLVPSLSHLPPGTGGSKAVTRTHQPILPTLWCLLLSLCPAADRWKDTGNRMQAKELKPLVGILILFLCLAAPALRWKDTGNRMRAKEPGGWWTGYVLLVNAHRWLNQSVTNRFHWWHHLTLIAPDNMSRASKGLVLFFVGAGLNDHGRGDWSYHIPKDSDVFIRVAAP
ncbi:unnamed protein product, partial [Closterium sp. NIES-65]